MQFRHKTMIKIKFTTIIALGAAVSLISSCATTKGVENTQTSTIETIESESTEKVKKEPKPISVQNTSNQQEKQFKELVDTLELKVTGKPKATYAKNAFNTAYTVTVTGENGPAEGISITVSYPSSRTNDTVSFSNIQLTTDAEGKITFKPETPSFAVKSEVTFYPTPVSSNSTVVQAAYNAAVKAPYIVKSSYVTYPYGILYVYDYNENGKPTTNNFTLLQNLRNSGVSVGNSPISDLSFMNRPVSELYKANYNIVGNSYNFLVAGSFKYTEPAVETESEATVKMAADLTCIDMKTGEVIYKTVIEHSATEKNKWTAEQKCRKVLAEKATEALIYGM